MKNLTRPLAPKSIYLKRVYEGAAISLALITFSLAIGISGYHFLGHLRWVDSLLNASMILAGMGPVDNLKSDAAKIFASFYAIYSGVSFLTVVAVLFAPIYHRFLHRFHLYISQEEEDEGDKG